VKSIIKLSLVASLVIVNSYAVEGGGYRSLEINALATTKEVYSLGASYKLNKNVKVGAGGLYVGNVKSPLSTSIDKFKGGYGTIELKYPLMNKLDIFADGAYIGGKIDKINKSINKGIGAGGLKYYLNQRYDLYTGYTTEDDAFAGVEFKLTPKWKLNLGGSYNTDYHEGQALISLSYNFGSGFNSIINASAKHMVEKEYRSYVKSVVNGSGSGSSGIGI